MRASFTGSSEYSDKRLVAFQVTPELGKGAGSKVLGAPLPTAATTSCLRSTGLSLSAVEPH